MKNEKFKEIGDTNQKNSYHLKTYLRELTLRGFKSFKHCKILFPPGYAVIAGANGSGKSNIVDSLRFVMGETSIKSLRANRISDLVNWDAKEAFVKMICVLNGKKYEIKRYINKEGKSFYKLNGRKTTRFNVIDLLRRHNMMLSPHNTIAQGEVQKIVEMNAKERRQIIDTVAGISEFEEKKNEAIRELDKVQRRINDAGIVLETKEGFLKELEKERDNAIKYLDAQETYKRARATLIYKELNKVEKEYKRLEKEINEINKKIESTEHEKVIINNRIRELSIKKSELTDKINELSSKDNILKKLEDTRIRLNVERNAREKLNERIIEIKKEIKRLKEEKQVKFERRTTIEKEKMSIEKEIKDLEKKIPKKDVSSELELKKLRQEYNKLIEDISNIREEKARLTEEIKGIMNRISDSEKEPDELNKIKLLNNEEKLLAKDINDINKRINRMFEKEKEILNKIPKLDKDLLKLKEEAARLRPFASGKDYIINFIDSIKDKIPGIYGTVAELISFEDEYSDAVQMSAGGRLRYVVVENVDTAVKVIKLLKKEKVGQVTFIPLDKIIPKISKGEAKGTLGSVLKYVKFDPRYYNAIAYVFGNTQLVRSISEAKKFIGKYRTVTLSGELFEISGTISGGSHKGSISTKMKLNKVEKNIEIINSERSDLYKELEGVRADMSRLRKERAQMELKYKNITVELAKLGSRKESDKLSVEKLKESLTKSKKILGSIDKKLSIMNTEKKKLTDRIMLLEKEIDEKTNSLDEQTKKIINMISELKGKYEGIKKESELLLESIRDIENRMNKLDTELKTKTNEIKEKKLLISKCENEMKGYEKKVRKKGEDMDNLWKEVKEIDEELNDAANSKGKLEHELNNLNDKLKNYEIKRAGNETRLIDLKTEYEGMKNISLIEEDDIKKLEKIIIENEKILKDLGNVNLKAPEVYEDKKKELDEINDKIEQLRKERESILNMISEIDSRKKTIFMDTFYSINNQFKKLYDDLFKEKGGHLQLTTPSDPFNGGVIIKAKKGDSYRNIESFSGGEKAMLALLFIFSIIMIRKSPLYLMDEADAPLDKENSKKLASLVKHFSSESQFVIVSHNDTMIKNADVAFGVSKEIKSDESKIIGLALNMKEDKLKKTISEYENAKI